MSAWRDMTDPRPDPKDQRIAALTAERDGLAAALDNCNKEWTDALESVKREMDDGAQFENPFLAASARKALATLEDRWTPAATLAARDERMKRQGAVGAYMLVLASMVYRGAIRGGEDVVSQIAADLRAKITELEKAGEDLEK